MSCEINTTCCFTKFFI